MHEIVVEILTGAIDLAAAWRTLVDRASANVFMDPAAINAVHTTTFASTSALAAWDKSGGEPQLIGMWALRKSRVRPFGPAILTAPPYDYAFVSSPVVDRDRAGEVVAAFFATIAADPAMPNVMRLRYLDGGDTTYPAIIRALAARSAHTLVLSEKDRAYASRDSGVKKSGSTRKKLRQDWNRLSAGGALEYVNARGADAVRANFDTFLLMEQASWKGGTGTAMLSDPETAAFTRNLIGNLADSDGASVAMLKLDGKPIAAQVVLYSGRIAYTWKTAYDAEHGKHSPGAVLVDKVAEELFAGDSIDAIESCSPDGSFMSQLWSGRRATIDLLVDLGTRKSLTFAAIALGVRTYAGIKQIRNRLHGQIASWRRKRTPAAKPAEA